MDQLKVVLAAVKKYQFWVLCGVMLLTILVCWWLAASDLSGQYKNRVSQIDADFTGAKVQDNQPNQAMIDKIGEQHKLLKKNVYNAWESLYKLQKEKNPFPRIPGKDFTKEFEKLLEKFPVQGTLKSIYREQYMTFLSKSYLPGLLKMADIRRPIEEGELKGAADPHNPAGAPPANMPNGRPMAGAPNRDAGLERQMTGIVVWDKDLNQFWDRFQWTTVPSTMDMVLAQEDLWVYEALLRVIKSVNAAATNQTNAPIKRINALEIGKNSRDAWKNSLDTVFHSGRSGSGPGGTPSGPGATGPGPHYPPGMSGGMGPGGPGDRQSEQDLFLDRYVDEKGERLPVEAEFPYVKHPNDEFKMMPIHINLWIDQRAVSKLLAECANCNMPIEVRRVRILKTAFPAVELDATSSKSPGGMSSGDPYGPSGGRSGGFAPPGVGGGSNPGTGAQGMELTGDLDVPIDIFAIIYIYNPPNQDKLGTGTASADNPTDAAPAVEPAAPAPAKATPPPKNPATPKTPPAVPGKKP